MTGRLDPRAWLLWWVAVSLPALVGRNPLPLLIALMVVVAVRTLISPANHIVSAGIIRVFLVLTIVSVVFNLMTVHAGNVALLVIPDRIPLFGGNVTLNAIVYGLLSGIAMLTLVVAGMTAAEQIEWARAMRLLPDSLLGVGAAGSIALAFFPQVLASLRDIREARLMRGAPLVTPRDYATIVAPMLTSALDRAVVLSELLEVRSFGGNPDASRSVSRITWLLPGAIAALASGAYLYVTGSTLFALAVSGLGVVAIAATRLANRDNRLPRTRYRDLRWTHADSLVALTSLIAIVVVFRTLAAAPYALRYEPYPDLTWPSVSLVLVAALCGLLSPALVASRQEGSTWPES